MVCYARPAGRLAALALVALCVFGRPLSHVLGTAEFMVAAVAVTGATAVTTALVFAALMSTRQRRAAAGGCVGCQFRCQHAMTGPPSRLALVTRTERSTVPPAPAAPVLLPMPAVRAAGPSWPDRPAASRRTAAPEQVRA